MKKIDIDTRFKIIRMIAAIGIAFMLTFIIITLISDDPVNAIISFITGPFLSVRRLGNIIELAIPLTFTGLAISIMFRNGQINLAVEGAFFLGCVAATAVAVLPLPAGIHPILTIIAGGLTGMLVCFIPAILKIKWNANVVVSSLMLNYVCFLVGMYIINYHLRDPQAGFVASYTFKESALLPVVISGTRIHTGLFYAIFASIVCHFFVNKSKWGYALRMVGDNPSFAKYSGISVAWVMLYAQLIGGFLAGVGGSVEIIGIYKRFQYMATTGYGFDGVIIAALAGRSPKYVPLTALFFAYMKVGADILARTSDVPTEIILIVQAVIILCIGARNFMAKTKHRQIVRESKIEYQG